MWKKLLSMLLEQTDRCKLNKNNIPASSLGSIKAEKVRDLMSGINLYLTYFEQTDWFKLNKINTPASALGSTKVERIKDI